MYIINIAIDKHILKAYLMTFDKIMNTYITFKHEIQNSKTK